MGIAKIFDYNDIDYDRKGNYIEFEDTALDGFEENYFRYFTGTYEKFTTWYKIISFKDYIDNLDLENINKKDLKRINDYIEYSKSKLKSNSYKSAYKLSNDNSLDILACEKNLKKITMTKKQKIEDKVVKDKIQEQIELIKNIINYLTKPNVKTMVLSKNIMYDLIQNFWSEVSFLHVKSNNKDMCDEYKNYFIDSALNYLKEDKKKFKYTCFTCDNKISKLSKPASYDLTWIKKIGVDMSRKSSHFWDFNGDSFICPLCNLVYSCIPAGFTVIRNNGLFINENSSVDTLIKINKMGFDSNTSFEELEERSYFNIVDNIEQSKAEHLNKEIENIQIIKLDAENDRRPYTFNMLSKDMLNLINNNKKMLRTIINVSIKVEKNDYRNLYREVIGRLYNNKNQFDLINDLFQFYLEDKFKKVGYIETIIKINNNFIGGRIRGKMVSYKDINNCKDYGLDLKKAYEDKKASNKLNGITYRLLNALKTKNTSRFMDTLLNAYMYLSKSIPATFLEALKDVDKFQTIGYSFLLGLQGETKNNKSENKGEEDINVK